MNRLARTAPPDRIPGLSRPALLVAAIFILALGETWLIGHKLLLPVVQLTPGLVLAGLLVVDGADRIRFALAAFVAQALAMSLCGIASPGALHDAAGIVATAGCAVFLLKRFNPERLEVTRAQQTLSSTMVVIAVVLAIGLMASTFAVILGSTRLDPEARGLDWLGVATHLVLPRLLGISLTAPIAYGFLKRPGGWGICPDKGLRLLIHGTNLLTCCGVWFFDHHSLLFMIAPPLALVAICLGIRDTAAALLLMQFVGSYAAARGIGPLILFDPDPVERLARLQVITLSAYACALPVAASLAIRNELKERLAASLAFTDQILRHMGEVVFRTDAAGRWTYLNPAWEALTGYTVGESLGLHATVFLTPGSPAWRHETYPDLLSGKLEEMTIERQYVRKDGQIRDIEVSVRAFRGADGAFAGTAGSIRDTTDRQRLLRDLRRSEHKFRELCDTAPIGIMRTDCEGVITYANRMLELVLLIPSASLLGRVWHEFLADNSERQREAIYQAIGSPNATVEREVQILDASNQPRWVNFIITGEFDESAQLLGYIAAVTDITRRKLAEDQLARTSTDLIQLASNINDMVFRTSLDGTCLYATPSVRKGLGFEPRQVIGKSVFARLHPDDEEMVRFALATLVNGERDVFSISYRTRPAGTRTRYVWVEASCRLLRDSEGRPSEIIAALRDVSTRKQLEIDLIEARYKAEAADQAKSAFLANISHEIRTPMNGVIGLTELLLQRELDETSRNYATLIHDSGEAMIELLNDVLDLAKIESGQLHIAREPFDLQASLRNAMQLLTARGLQKGLRMDLEIAPGTPALWIGDRLRLNQILINLIGNAIKFTASGSVGLSAGIDGENLVIAVTDTGIGIASELHEAVFEDFVQARPHTASAVAGTGLGLPISRRLAQAMGGTLSLSSSPGVGSRLELRLPASFAAEDPPPPRAQTPSGPAPASIPLRILVAEDNRTNQIIATGMLDRLGHSHVVAGDGREAIERVRQAAAVGEPFDAVLMDIQMPELDGYAAARELRKLGFTEERLPIIAVTAGVLEQDIALCRAAGMQDHIAKPLRLATLSRRLQAIGENLPQSRRAA